MRVLLIGGSGEYGVVLRAELESIADVVVSQRQFGTSSQNYFDALQPRTNLGWLANFNTVIYAVGLPSIRACEEAPDDSRKLNFLTPALLSEYCHSRQVQFIFLSTNAVIPFVGRSRVRAERLWTERGVGATRYGLDRALGERQTLKNRGTVVRLSKIALPLWSPLNSWIEILKSGHEVEAFCDHYVSPIDARTASIAVTTCVLQNYVGLIQVSATDQLSYFEIASLLATRFGNPGARLRAIRASEVLGREFAFTSTILDSSDYSALTGREPMGSREVIEAWCDGQPSC